jgi:hypothetical protein
MVAPRHRSFFAFPEFLSFDLSNANIYTQEIRSLGGKKSDKKVEELLQEKAYAKVCNVSEKLSVPEKSSSLQKTKCFF